MIKQYLIHLLTFFLLVLLQILVFDNMQFSAYVNPYVYILFIILLPLDTPRWFLLLLGFALGLSVDLLAATPGLHAIAALVMSFLRPYLLVYVSPRNGYEEDKAPRVRHYGLGWFARYALLMVLIHHLMLFYVEVFSFANFFHTLLRVVLSSLISTTFIVLSQFFVFRE